MVVVGFYLIAIFGYGITDCRGAKTQNKLEIIIAVLFTILGLTFLITGLLMIKSLKKHFRQFYN